MCGIVGLFGSAIRLDADAMVRALRHRGPDHQAVERCDRAALGHTRLRILDLSTASDQPFVSADGRFHLLFNGEIYNFVELRRELGADAGRTSGDAEVVLASYLKWGPACLDRFIGMFALVVWDDLEGTAFLARDRFGVKPLYFSLPDNGLVVASEITAFHEVGIGRSSDRVAWASYLATGRSEFSQRTFWEGIHPIPAGHRATWADGRLHLSQWYQPPEQALAFDDPATDADAETTLRELLIDTVRLRFRSDVKVGVCLSGGLDSSALLGLIHAHRGPDDDVAAFTFSTGDPGYDETPWVERMLASTRHPLVECRLDADAVPDLAESVHRFVAEPFGGIPTLAYARLFETAADHGVTVLLDGQGLDEAFCGYDYFRFQGTPSPVVQGSTGSPIRPGVLTPGSDDLLDSAGEYPRARSSRVETQLRDLFSTKLPRALRYNDRVSMRSSRELREPFLDHRVVEFGLARPDRQLFDQDSGKRIVRRAVKSMLPADLIGAPKRAVQTPQREWLRGPLRSWVEQHVAAGLAGPLEGLVDPRQVHDELRNFMDGGADNSFFVWQWISAGLTANMMGEW